MKKSLTIFKYAGVASIPVYIIFTFISYLFNSEINPFKNWLSDFGNPILNPSGAVYYNLGCDLIALLLLIFFVGIFNWYKGFRISKKYTICYIIAQASGIISCVFLVLTTVFTLGVHTEIHSTASLLHMIGMDFFLTFSATAFLLNPKINKAIGIFGFAAAFFNIITTNVFTNLYIAEWIYFLMFMIYLVVILLHYNMLLVLQEKEPKVK